MYHANGMIDEDGEVDLIYLDFMKAFDSVPHKRLLSKLASYGIKGKALDIINAFLCNRQFVVRISDTTSKGYKVRYGVPQGTILGPLLFLIYINELPDGIGCFSFLFADDLKLLIEKSNRTMSQKDLNYLTEWQNRWLLRFNTADNKCKVMYAGRTRIQTQYILNSNTLPATENEKDLGVTVTLNLKRSENIQKCKGNRKANRMMGWITRNLITKDIRTMVTVYKTIIRPHLEYCVQLWNPDACQGNWKIIRDIEKVQRDFTRRINDIGLLSYHERLLKCGLTTLVERRARGDLIECFKIWKGLVNYGNETIKTSRSGYKLLLQANRGTRKHSFFPHRIINYWNKILDYVKDAESTECFKSRLQSFKQDAILRNCTSGHYWELSEEIITKIEASQTNRESYVSYMSDNPNVACRKFISMT